MKMDGVAVSEDWLVFYDVVHLVNWVVLNDVVNFSNRMMMFGCLLYLSHWGVIDNVVAFVNRLEDGIQSEHHGQTKINGGARRSNSNRVGLASTIVPRYLRESWMDILATDLSFSP